MNRKLVAGLAIAAIVVSLGSLYRGCHPRGLPPPDLRPLSALGEVLAEETAKLVAGQGQVLLLVSDAEAGKETNDPSLAAFRETLQKSPGLRVVATVPVALVDDPVFTDMGHTFSADDFFKVLKEYPDVDVIVSFRGVPALGESDHRRLPARLPRLIAWSTSRGRRLTNGMRSGLVQVAIVPHPGPLPANALAPVTTRDFFDQAYTVITAANLDQPPQ